MVNIINSPTGEGLRTFACACVVWTKDYENWESDRGRINKARRVFAELEESTWWSVVVRDHSAGPEGLPRALATKLAWQGTHLVVVSAQILLPDVDLRDVDWLTACENMKDGKRIAVVCAASVEMADRWVAFFQYHGDAEAWIDRIDGLDVRRNIRAPKSHVEAEAAA